MFASQSRPARAGAGISMGKEDSFLKKEAKTFAPGAFGAVVSAWWRGVAVTPRIIDGVPCFMVAPKVIQAANRNRLLIHIHGGLWAVSRYVGHGRSDPDRRDRAFVGGLEDAVCTSVSGGNR